MSELTWQKAAGGTYIDNWHFSIRPTFAPSFECRCRNCRYQVPVAGRRLLASRQPLLRIACRSGACEWSHTAVEVSAWVL